MNQPALFSSDFIRKLESLILLIRRPMPGPAVGRRRAPGLGSSVEFADVRNYTPGDDYRRIDWNAYARLERLFLKLYRAEEGLRVSLLLDTSRSMGWGQPAKLDFARSLASALAYVALNSDDRVSVVGLSDRIHSYIPPQSGRAAVRRVWGFLEQLPTGDATDLNTALAEMARYRPRPGLAILITDLLSPKGYQTGLKSLFGLRQEVVLLQVLAPEELKPDLTGHWRLVDDEEETPMEVTVTPDVLQAYRERLDAFVKEVADFCHSYSITFLQLRSDLSIEEVVLRLLHRARVVA